MMTFILLGKYTADALKGMSAQRTEDAVEAIGQCGGEVEAMYATLGPHDLVLVVLPRRRRRDEVLGLPQPDDWYRVQHLSGRVGRAVRSDHVGDLRRTMMTICTPCPGRRWGFPPRETADELRVLPDKIDEARRRP